MTDTIATEWPLGGEEGGQNRGKWVAVGLLWFVVLFNYGDRLAIFSVFPLLKQQMSLTDVQLGVLGSSFMWMYAAFGPFAGWVGDRVSRKWIIIGSLVFWSVVTALTAVCQNFGELVVCRALGGLGEAFYFPAAMSMIGDYHSPRTRSRAMSLHQSAVYAGSIAGASIPAVLGQRHGWRLSFVLFGVCGVVLGMVLTRLLREPKRSVENVPVGQDSLWTAFGGIFQNSAVLSLMLIFMGANFVAVIFLTWLPTFLFEKFHMSLAMAGLNSSAYLQIASLVGVICGGVLADRFASRRRGGRMWTQAVGLFGGVPFLFLTGWTTSVVVLVSAMTGFGLFKGIYDANIFASLYDVVPVRRRAAVVGLINSMGWLAGGTAPVVVAVAAAHVGLSACISATACIYLVIGLWMWRLSIRVSRSEGGY
jgi:MFS family permease